MSLQSEWSLENTTNKANQSEVETGSCENMFWIHNNIHTYSLYSHGFFAPWVTYGIPPVQLNQMIVILHSMTCFLMLSHI